MGRVAPSRAGQVEGTECTNEMPDPKSNEPSVNMVEAMGIVGTANMVETVELLIVVE